MKKRLFTLLITAIAILLLLIMLWPRKESQAPQVYSSVATDLREMVRLTSLEGERIVPITYRNKGVGAFAIGHYRVRISFDIEQMQQKSLNDTLYLLLPTPQVQILEHEEDGFTVFDVWGENIGTKLLGAKLSVDSENEMKKRAITQLRKELQADGSVKKAKREAIELIHKLYGMLPGTVVVLDSPSDMPPEAVDVLLGTPNLSIKN